METVKYFNTLPKYKVTEIEFNVCVGSYQKSDVGL